MTVTTTREEPIPDSANRYASDSYRLVPPVKIFILTAAAIACLCGFPQLVGKARAGGGGGGGGCSQAISYAYDAAGRLTCVYSNCAGSGVIYNYDAVGNMLSITNTSTACPQNTMRSVVGERALASSRRVPVISNGHTHRNLKIARVARARRSKLRNLWATAGNKPQPEEKPLTVSLR
jgi:hypothetical protein